MQPAAGDDSSGGGDRSRHQLVARATYSPVDTQRVDGSQVVGGGGCEGRGETGDGRRVGAFFGAE